MRSFWKQGSVSIPARPVSAIWVASSVLLIPRWATPSTLPRALKDRPSNTVCGFYSGSRLGGRPPEFAVLELDLIRVKGKREPERIFVLLGDAEMAQSEYFKDWEEKHNRMLEAYRAMKWDEARKLADQCQEISKEGMTMFYLMFTARIADMKKTPPRPDWNGVFVATSK